ncbi:hypothetical protein Ancab_017892 [Ancistrocladus abbreviatus]
MRDLRSGVMGLVVVGQVKGLDHTPQGNQREEFSDWPNGLLAIGTFGNKALKEDPKGHNVQDASSPSQELTPEEFRLLRKELNALFSQDKISAKSTPHTDQEHCDPPPDKFLHCSPFSVTDEKKCGHICSGRDEEESDHLQDRVSVLQNKGKDVGLDNPSNTIRKKSLSFLLKKMFVSRSGFSPAPSFKDPLTHPESRMEKILRKILQKKIHPQNSSPTMSTKKYLQRRQKSRTKTNDYNKDNHKDDDDKFQDEDEGNDGSKWVKTDTECISWVSSADIHASDAGRETVDASTEWKRPHAVESTEGSPSFYASEFAVLTIDSTSFNNFDGQLWLLLEENVSKRPVIH